MLPDSVLKLIQERETVSSALAQDPSTSPLESKYAVAVHVPTNSWLTISQVCKKLYAHHRSTGSSHDTSGVDRVPATAEDLTFLLSAFQWGARQPSELFLRAFYDALHCLDADPLCGVVSPPLMGSCGTIPLTVIAPLADIFRHMSNLIVRAQKEVVFITCSWSPSLASRLISEVMPIALLYSLNFVC